MHFSFAIVALAAGVVSATVLPRQLPSCAQTCSSTAPMGSCEVTDTHCLCTSSDFVTQSTLCIEKSCSAQDAATAEELSRQLCAAVGVTLTSTPVATSTPDTTSTSASGSTTGSTTATSGSTAATGKSSGSTSGSSATSTSPSSQATSPAPSPSGNSAFTHSANAAFILAGLGLSAALL